MTLSEIMTLLAQNQRPEQWKRRGTDDGSMTAYCVSNVLLRLDSKVTWKKEKPVMEITLSYDSSILATFDLPIGPSGGANMRKITAHATKILSDTRTRN